MVAEVDGAGESAVERLFRSLAGLEEAVQQTLAEEVSFRVANAAFQPSNQTTKLLLAACEKLADERDAIARTNFEEHTADVAYLCKHYNTSVVQGVADRSQASGAPAASGRASWLCCSREFPPRRSWWLDVERRVVPVFQVLRGGKLVAMTVAQLLPGDIVYLSVGERCAADARVLAHEAGTTVDASHVCAEHEDVRVCTVGPTAASSMHSCNILLRDSFVSSGALFCMVVRAPRNPLVASPTRDAADGARFLQDASVPSGLSVAQCGSLFKQLVTRGRLACRSFQAMVRLARVRVLVVLLSQDLVDGGTVPALAAAAQGSGKALVLVPCGCSRWSLERLAQELQATWLDAGGEGSSAASHPPGRSEERSGVSSPASGPLFRLRFARDDYPRLAVLSDDILLKRTACAVLLDCSEGGLIALCHMLSDRGAPVLYALGRFQMPVCFRHLVVGTCHSGQGGGRHGPMQSPIPSLAEAGSRNVSVAQMAGTMSQASCSSRVSHTPPTASTDPAAVLRTPRSEAMSIVDVVVCINAVSVVSELADAVLVTSDLGALGASIDLVCRAVPPAPSPGPSVPVPRLGEHEDITID